MVRSVVFADAGDAVANAAVPTARVATKVRRRDPPLIMVRAYTGVPRLPLVLRTKLDGRGSEMRRQVFSTVIGIAIAMGPAGTAHGTEIPPDQVGFYYQHAGGMKVRADGTIRVSFQWYYKRDKGLPSFPRLTLVVDEVSGRSLRGRVVAQRQSPVRVGSRFVVRQRPPGMRLRVRGFPYRWQFCDQANQGQCGA